MIPVFDANGSFVTTKEQPGDLDGCWEVDGVDPDKLDPVLLEFVNRRTAQKAKYHGELYPCKHGGGSRRYAVYRFLSV